MKRENINATTQTEKISGQLRQQICYLGVFPFKISAEIKHDAGEKVNDQWEADGKERRVNKKQAYFINRNVEAFADVCTNAERVPFEKSDYPLQHIKPFLVFYFQRRIAGISYSRSNYFLAPIAPANQKRY